MEKERVSLSKLHELKAQQREVLATERKKLEEIKEKQGNLKMVVMNKKQNKALVEGGGGMELGRLKTKQAGVKGNVEEFKDCATKIRDNSGELYRVVAGASEDLLSKTEEASMALTTFSEAESKFKDVEDMIPKRAELEKEFNELSVEEATLAASALRNPEVDGGPYVLDIDLENAKVFRGDFEIP